MSAKRSFLDRAAREPIPALAHLGPRQAEDLGDDAELEGAEPVVEKRDDEGAGRVWHDLPVVWRSCRLQGAGMGGEMTVRS